MVKVMIVDDSSILRKTLKNLLEELGYTVVHEAVDGRDAVDHYLKYKPDIVTMDISMPVLNGYLALNEIKHLDEDAKVLMVTSHGEEELVMDCIESGAIGYILKPITKEKLEEYVNKI